MGKREPLKPNTELRVTNAEGGAVCYTVTGVIGSGGACIAYEGYYTDNTGAKKPVRMKECYPHKLSLVREADGSLRARENEVQGFEAAKEKFRTAFSVANRLFATKGLTNMITNGMDIYEKNNTIYIVTVYIEGSALSEYEIKELGDAVKLVTTVAKGIARLHREGYLYLDLKPENIFVLDETKELVQFFDFDSMLPIGAGEDGAEGYVSYTAGFSPVEQKLGGRAGLGVSSDVYSVGALLFYLLFGRTPTPLDCGDFSEYDYTKMKWGGTYQDKLYPELTKFFQNTLQSYYPDRYPSMEEAVLQLEALAGYAEVSVPFLKSSRLNDAEYVIGREAELARLEKWADGGSRSLAVCGEGGIGKSTLVRHFLCQRKERFDFVIYLYYEESVCKTITDDNGFYIHNYEKREEESDEEYFYRKMRAAYALLKDKPALLVIDNYDGKPEEKLEAVMDAGFRVILITRAAMEGMGHEVLPVGRIASEDMLRELFCHRLGRGIKENEEKAYQRLVKLVGGHTLAMELIAGQISKSYLTLPESVRLAEENGFSQMAPEKVDYVKDGKRQYDRISRMIQAVYDVEGMPEEKKTVLKLLSVFDLPGILREEFRDLLGLTSYDAVNELCTDGWMCHDEGYFRLLPIVQEAMRQAEWTEASRGLAEREMELLLQEIKKKGSKKEFLGRHRMARSVLKYCGRDAALVRTRAYKSLLLFAALLATKDQEKFIRDAAEAVFADAGISDIYSKMELYDYTVFVCLQQGDIPAAEKYLSEAERFAGKQKNHHLWGLFHEMKSEYYDFLLQGAYAYHTMEEERICAAMIKEEEAAIRHMRRSKKEKAPELLAKYLLAKATYLIRSTPEKRKAILQLLREAGGLMSKKALERAEDREHTMLLLSFYLAEGWYYTICEPEKEEVSRMLHAAREVLEASKLSPLDEIDYYCVPAGNMMCELGEVQKGLEYLEQGIAICESEQDIVPYVRKKQELLGYQAEVYQQMGDEEGYKRVSGLLEEMEKEMV